MRSEFYLKRQALGAEKLFAITAYKVMVYLLHEQGLIPRIKKVDYIDIDDMKILRDFFSSIISKQEGGVA